MEGNKDIASIYSLLTAQQHQACVPPAEIKQSPFNPLPYDTGFAQDGKLTISMDGRSIGWVSSVVPVGAGTDQYLVSFYETFSPLNPQPYTNAAGILCMNAEGKIDLAFGTRRDGIVPVRFASEHYTMPHSISVLPDALIVEGIHFRNAGQRYQERCVTRLHRDGTPDLTYGVEGVVNFHELFGAPFDVTGSLVLPDGRMMVSGFNALEAPFERYLISLTSRGKLDPDFGVQGIMKLPVQIAPGPVVSGLEMSERDDKFFIYGFVAKSDRVDGFVGRFTMKGQLDTQFADKGYCYIDTRPGQSMSMLGFSSAGHRLGLLVSGEYYIKVPSESLLMRYTINGAINIAFNNGLPVRMPFIENSESNHWRGATFLPSGQIAAIGLCTLPNLDRYDIIGRFSSDGRLDTTFAGGAGFGSPLNAIFFPSGPKSLVAAGPGRWLYPGSFAGRGAVMAFSI